MSTVLFTWIGITDLNVGKNLNPGVGPIGQSLAKYSYDEIVLLTDFSQSDIDIFVQWLKEKTKAIITVSSVKLSSPTSFGEIYEHVIHTLETFHRSNGVEYKRVYHLSPGTPSMAAVWIIVAKTRFPAELIQSSKEAGTQIASVPFDISADYLPDLLRQPDHELIRLSQGLPPEAPEFSDIIHRCAVMKRLVARARRVAPRKIPVLLLGESGTGKELFARAIHQSSTCRKGCFVPVNCGAIPVNLVESELFGHEKGAFTSAMAKRKGYIEQADGGTLFLDEIGELPLDIQIKLLRVLQEGQIMRLGATQSIKVDFRIIAATNRNLVQEVTDGRFREDLFHRIAVAVLYIPPLRDREGDINLIVDTIMADINNDGIGQPGYQHKNISVSARNLLAQQKWPGNIRELRNVLLRAVLWSPDKTIRPEDIRESMLPMPSSAETNLLERPLDGNFNIMELITNVVRHYLQRALQETNGNKTKAAALLGLPSYQTLTNWINRYGIK